MIEVWLVLIAVWCLLLTGRLAQHRHVVAVVWLAAALVAGSIVAAVVEGGVG